MEMPRRKKPKHNEDQALLKTGVYAVKGSKNSNAGRAKRNRLGKAFGEASQERMDQAKRMAQIEAYAKEHNITIAKAMIHFM